MFIDIKGPNSLIIKDKKDLQKKLQEGINDTENGKVRPLDEVWKEVEKILDDGNN